MLRFRSDGLKWWQKPLVSIDGRSLTAELAVLAHELCPGEQGVWLNSRGKTSGVAELVPTTGVAGASFRTRRQPLPAFVTAKLKLICSKSGLKKGCPDLAIWCTDHETLRLVEVKCPHWDSPSPEQSRFMETAVLCGVPVTVVEWEYEGRVG